MALVLIMGLCWLGYNLGQRQRRRARQLADQTLPNQLGKGTQRLTLRWVLQCLMTVRYVVLKGMQPVVNLSDDRRRLLQSFGSTCRQY